MTVNLHALTSMSKLLRHFDFGLVDPITPIKTRCHLIHIQGQMYVSVRSAESG